MAKGPSTFVNGVIASAIIATAALFVGEKVPVFGSAPAALALGVIVRTSIGESPVIAPGASWAAKRLLQIAIVLLGAGLSLTQLWELGGLTFGLIAVVVFLALVAITWIGRRMRLPAALSTLIAVGTAICGASAVAAASPVIKAREDETAYAISTILTFNLIALFTYPVLGHALDLPVETYAIWAGTAVHDTASAVAAGYAYGDESGLLATVVKLARTTLMIPVLFILAAIYTRTKQGEDRGASPWRKFPWFIAVFAGAALLRTVGLVPDPLAEGLTGLAKFLIVVALAGVGLGTDLSRIRSTGYKPLALGFVASVFISVLSLALAMQISA